MTPRFQFIIAAGGAVTKNPGTPWNVGMPGSTIELQLVNDDDADHRLRMVKFKHKGSGKSKDPLIGTKSWVALRNTSGNPTRHKVRDHGKGFYGYYEFITELDGAEGVDPEIVVDDPGGPPVGPPSTPPKPRKPKPRKPRRPAPAKTAKKAGKKSAKKAGKAAPARRAAKAVKRGAKKRGAKKRR